MNSTGLLEKSTKTKLRISLLGGTGGQGDGGQGDRGTRGQGDGGRGSSACTHPKANYEVYGELQNRRKKIITK